MHVVFREDRTLEGDAVAEDLGQAPGDLVVLSFSDSDLGAFAAAWREGRAGLPALRLANLARLRHPLSVDLYVERTLSGARGVLVRLLGGLEYWRYGVQSLAALAREKGVALALLPGDGRPDPTLDALSTVPASTLRRLTALCDAGGRDAARAALGQMALAAGLWADPAPPARSLPPAGFYAAGRLSCPVAIPDDARPLALVAFYRSFLAAADLAPVDALLAALEARGMRVAALYAPSLKAPEAAAWVRRWVARLRPAVIVNATAFSALGDDGASPLDAAGAPVLQVALSTADRAAWAASDRGLSPADLAMHVALPEIDGRVFAGAVSFKEAEAPDPDLGFSRRAHAAAPDRVAAVAARAARLATLAAKPAPARRVAIVLSTYPGRADQTAHAVGLDAPESAAAIVALLRAAGYDAGDAPESGAALLAALAGRDPRAAWPVASWRAALAATAPALSKSLEAVHGAPDGDPDVRDGAFRFRAAVFGNLLVALQPERGVAADRVAEYHDQRRPPRHGYAAFYAWLRHGFGADALVHVGAHGTLEWLPGKAVALSDACWPEALTGDLPVFYPFIVNDPGEAAMAKRRLGAVTIGHVTPPLRSAGAPANLRGLEALLDEYSTADGLDPKRRERLTARILDEARGLGLDRDLGLEPGVGAREAVTRIDAFVCDVKETQFQDGLHVFGRPPGAAADPDGPDLAACAAAEARALLAALDGRRVAPGPAGSPWRGRRDVLPTGRNLYAVDPRAVPSRAAAEQGGRLADLLVTRHLQDHGEYPSGVVVDLWGSATMRTAGEDFAMALALIGVAPVWDEGSARVSGFTVLPLAELGRPRIDVTLRVSGLFRDVFEGLPRLFEQAVSALRDRDEAPEDNPFRRDPDPRVFGPAPGAYGVAVAEGLGALTPEGLAAAGERWLAASAHAWGRADEGRAARGALERRVAAAGAFVHAQDLPETDIFAAPDWAAHEAGFAAAARLLTGRAPALYHVDATRPDAPKARLLAEEAARVVRGRAANPAWIVGMMRHGFRGAAEIAATLDHMAAYAHLAGAVASRHFDLYWEATLGDDRVAAFLAEANPAALGEMRRRFADLRAAGLWRPRRNSVAAALEGAA